MVESYKENIDPLNEEFDNFDAEEDLTYKRDFDDDVE